MPVTVKELIVRATVVDTSNNNGQQQSSSAKEINEEQRDLIISDCVDQVLQVLKNHKER